MSRAAALTYLQSPSDSNWRWADDCSVIVWHDGTTIAFREELEPLLETQAANGLPPFGAIVLLLAACKGKLPAESDFARTDLPLRPETPAANLQLIRTARERYRQTVTSALGELAKVASLPPDLIKTAAAKRILVEAAFESLKDDRRRDGIAILKQLKEPFNLSELNLPPAFRGGPDALRHLHIVSQGLRAHSVETLRLRIETGLDQLPGTPELDLLPAERARRLLQELQKDPEQAGFARIARDLLAAIRLPRALSEPDEQAIGGVSDLSNRGRLDRLLLSELAHDDLTLAARVALNEALYLRQEPPRREPEGGFSILIDAGVRLWGVPRVMATAATLALIAQGGRRSHVQCWRAHGNILARADLLTRPGLTEHLDALATEPHPGAALPAWLAGLDKSAETDAVIVTHFDTWADEDFRRALALTGNRPLLVLLVDRDGRFELHSVPGMNAPIAAAQVEVETLFADRAAPALREPDSPNDLPAIFRVKPFPILLPVVGDVQDGVPFGKGGVCITQDGRLWHWENSGQGARVIAAGPNIATRSWWNVDPTGVVRVLSSKPINLCLPLEEIHLATGQQTSLRLPFSGIALGAVLKGSRLMVVERSSLSAFDLASGQPVGRVARLRGEEWKGDLFFQNAESLVLVDDTTWEAALVKFSSGLKPAEIARAIRPIGHEGPLFLTKSGFLVTMDGKVALNLGRSAKVVAVSHDQTRIAVESMESWKSQILRLGESIHPLVWRAEVWRHLNSCPIPPERNLRCRFLRIAAMADGSLLLQPPKLTWWEFKASQPTALSLGQTESGPDKHLVVEFSPIEGAGEPGAKLQCAQWPDGSRAWLDGRGLLHLRSSDRSIPELTLTLNEGATAVWSSEGQTDGPTFFFGEERSSSTVADALRRFARTAAASIKA